MNNMKDIAVYKLDCIYDDPRYEGFSFGGAPSLLGKGCLDDDFLPDNPWLDWDATRLTSLWKPPKVLGRVRSFNDYPCVDTMPAFSQRAVDVLRDMLEPNGELLPLISDVGTYYAYNITTIANILNHDKSEIEWFDDSDSKSERPMCIDRYEFFPDRINGLTIFRLPETATEVFVTSDFVSRVRDAGLKGFDFAKLWPFPRGVDWEELHKKEEIEQMRRGLPKGQTLKGNTVIIILTLKAARPAKEERKRVNALMEQLDAILVDHKSDAPAVGNLEGSKFVKGECRLYFSCPDAEKLAKTLNTWVKNVKWDGDVTVLKQKSPFDESDFYET